MSNAPLSFQDLRIPWGQLWDYSIPSEDVKWDKHFRVQLTASGGADADAVVIIGVGDKARPKDYIQVWTIELEPVDTFSQTNVTVEFHKLTGGAPTPFNPERKAQQTADAAVVYDDMNPRDFLMQCEEQLRITFTNTSVAGPAGYEGHIVGRITREKN